MSTRSLLIFLVSCCLSACISYESSLPEGYEGPTAVVSSSARRIDRGKAQFFFVETIDGRQVENPLDRSIALSSGQGNTLDLASTFLELPTQPLVLGLAAGASYAMPIRAMLSNEKFFRRDVRFLPVAGEGYLVKGRLEDDFAVLWIEDTNGARVSEVMSIGELGDEINVPDTAAEPKDRKQLFESLSVGESVHLVQAKLGPPDGATFRVGNAFSFSPSGRTATTTLRYAGLGWIRASFGLANPSAVLRVGVERSSDHGWTPVTLRSALANADLDALRETAASLTRLTLLDVALLDVIADRVWADIDTMEDPVILAMNDLCRTLARSGMPQYHGFLHTVFNKARSRELSDAARQARNGIIDQDVDAYVPKAFDSGSSQ